MGRPAYTTTSDDALAAEQWIENQLKKNAFWLETNEHGITDFDRRYDAEKEWKKMGLFILMWLTLFSHRSTNNTSVWIHP